MSKIKPFYYKRYIIGQTILNYSSKRRHLQLKKLANKLANLKQKTKSQNSSNNKRRPESQRRHWQRVAVRQMGKKRNP